LSRAVTTLCSRSCSGSLSLSFALWISHVSHEREIER
jgi:hypothetical protein